jgi:hypothetical protein
VLIAIEKLRAICQQMPEYAFRGHKKPRGRDFYDIFTIVSESAVDLASTENIEIIRHVFAAKSVSLLLLQLIPGQREFHRPDWPNVQNSVSGDLQDFDFYFDFVLDQAERLKPLWDK